MAEKWRRCEKCRKVKAVEEFEGDHSACLVCETPVVRKASPRSPSPVTTTRVSPATTGEPGSTVRVATPMRDLRGRGDHEVRARRARVRALDRLAEQFSEEFDQLLAEERRAEGL